ncbi:hypothetical protein LCGC14_1156450 [marine sediment metagenome]|uniref:Uncharacterized protein n=1 Tax=marine sediment metagenome TaxID=412755 RepID=A0A0F9PZF4_9ZZZZ
MVTFDALWRDYQAMLRAVAETRRNRWHHNRDAAFRSHRWEPLSRRCLDCGLQELEFHAWTLAGPVWCQGKD